MISLLVENKKCTIRFFHVHLLLTLSLISFTFFELSLKLLIKRNCAHTEKIVTHFFPILFFRAINHIAHTHKKYAFIKSEPNNNHEKAKAQWTTKWKQVRDKKSKLRQKKHYYAACFLPQHVRSLFLHWFFLCLVSTKLLIYYRIRWLWVWVCRMWLVNSLSLPFDLMTDFI